jgi:hypothetical protein
MITFEDIQSNILPKTRSPQYILISILPESEQSCLIEGTLTIEDEVTTMNQLIKSGKTFDHTIYVYGKNAQKIDDLIASRKKLKNAGFHDVHIYLGGLFEWLLLQDIYGRELFPTTSIVLDLLKFSK